MWEVLQGAAPKTGPHRTVYRIGLCRTPYWDAANIEERAALMGAAKKLAQSGFEIEEIVLPDSFSALNDCHAQLMAYEAARNFVFEFDVSRRSMLGETTRQAIDAGWQVSPSRYFEIRASVRRAQAEFSAVCSGFDALITPSAPGEAPVISSTGNPVFNRMWTLLGVPAITIPVAKGPNLLPLGIQFVGPVDSDLVLLDLCRRAEDVLKEKFSCD